MKARYEVNVLLTLGEALLTQVDHQISSVGHAEKRSILHHRLRKHPRVAANALEGQDLDQGWVQPLARLVDAAGSTVWSIEPDLDELS
jgi:hypothetical protein